MEVMSFVIKGDAITKKNHQEIAYKYVGSTKVPFIRQSKYYRDYEEECLYRIKRPKEPIDYGVNVKYLFYRKTKRRCDLTNLLSSLDDILVKSGVLKDDNFNIIVGHDGSRILFDKDNPRTEVYISTLESEVIE